MDDKAGVLVAGGGTLLLVLGGCFWLEIDGLLRWILAIALPVLVMYCVNRWVG